MNKGKTIERLSRSEAFAVNKLIESHGKTLDNGLFEYEVGWNDDRIAAELKVSLVAVQNSRRDVFGKLHFRGQSAADAETENRLTVLEVGAKAQRVSNFELGKRVEALEKAVNILLQGPNREGIDRAKLDDLRRHFNGSVTPTAKAIA